jgi:uncharacterized protein (DUF1501 family)
MISRPSLPCPGPLSRRQFLKLGAMALGGLGLANLPVLRAAAKQAGQSVPDTSVIFIWLPGGPPHLEMYDMKPDAPAEYRGDFRPIQTNVPGIDVCEHMPLHARVADKFAVIRSIAHNFAGHDGGHKRFLTGRDPLQPDGFVNDHPMVGSMVARVRQDVRAGVPNYVAVVDAHRQHIDTFSFGSAYLGPATHPFSVVGDPSQKDFKVQNLAPAPQVQGQVKERVRLLAALDGMDRGIDTGGTMAAMDTFQQRGLDLLTTDVAPRAFDLSREPAKVRERYGMHVWGQRALMARRLVEAGASFVTVVMENPYQGGIPMPTDGVYNWDSHAVNCHLFNDTRRRLLYYDRAITALIEDLYARGLDRQVMLIVTGEFGRTPRLESSVGTQTKVKQPGRDHWPHAMSVLVSGGGMKMGQVVGSTTARGEHPRSRPLTPNDLWATMFRHLGIDWDNTFFLDHRGRPMPILPHGEPIAELL